MNSRERVLRTYNRLPVDRTPIDCWLYQKQFVEMLETEYGSRDQFLDEFNIDIFVGFVPWPNQLGHRVDVTELAKVDLGDPRDPRWLNHTRWNDDFGGLNVQQAVERHGGRRAIIAHTWGMVEGTSSFLGIENCWLNLGAEPALMIAWFDRYSDWLCGLAESLKDNGVDIMTLSDDWGSNQTMLFSPRMWRKSIAPYTARVVRHARAIGLEVNLHSDGHILAILPDLIEIGYGSMHPVQESAGMDPQLIKDTYGDKIVIYGSLDVIDGLLTHEGEALDEYITRRFAIYAPGGGFIFNTGHFVQPDIPPMRLVQAYRKVNELARLYGTL
jgi:uroporphyrinogen decarboxylase